MRRANRTLGLTLIFFLLLAAFGEQGVQTVSAASLNHAGLVVRHGDARLSFSYVTFEEEEISGVELLKRSGFDVVTVSFGGLGEGICSIDEHGCPSTDCRKRVCQGSKADDPFWQYFRQIAIGEWKALALGASGTKVRDGDVDGWSWTGTTPDLPPLTLAEIAVRAGYTGDGATPAATELPGAVFRREGTIAGSDNQEIEIYLAAGGLLAAAGALSLVVFRKRRQIGEP